MLSFQRPFDPFIKKSFCFGLGLGLCASTQSVETGEQTLCSWELLTGRAQVVLEAAVIQTLKFSEVAWVTPKKN